MGLEITARGMLTQLERRWRRWPARLAVEARRYLMSGRSSTVGAAQLSAPLPYVWLLLPSWLLARIRPRPSKADMAFLTDILFAQYALFLFIRIHDDLLDRHVRSPWLVYVADRYLIEAEAAFGKHLSNQRFWKMFRDSIGETLEGIAESHVLQRQRQPDREALLQSYARVASIFKVGTAAVLIRYRRMAMFRRIAAFKDQLAIASQIVDDLEDLDEDAADGRRNYAAAVGAGSRANGMKTALDELERRLCAAREAIGPLGLRQADRHVAQQLQRLTLIRVAAHRAHVNRVFGRLGRVDAI